MKTNEQTKNEELMRESLILKGIANNLLSMHFPKFKNLEEMFLCFNYDVNIIEKILKSENSVIAFFLEHQQLQFKYINFDLDIAEKNSNHISGVYGGIMKKIVLCENTIYLHKNPMDLELVDFDANHGKYYKIIEFLSERDNIYATNLPIFQYWGETYSVDDHKFKNVSELINFFFETKNNVWFVYQIKIFVDGTIILRGNQGKKGLMKIK